MSQSVETPASAGGDLRDVLPGFDRRAKREGAPPGSAGAILFNELVLAHFRWFTMNARFGEVGGVPAELAPAVWPPEKPPSAAERQAAEDDYREKLEEFTRSEGEIVAAYWATRVPSGVVMTMKRPSWPLRLFMDSQIGLHRATTWLTEAEPRVAELLHHCDTLGNKAAQLLRGTPKRVAMTWIFSTESYLLGIVEQRSRVNCVSDAPLVVRLRNGPRALAKLVLPTPRARDRRPSLAHQSNGAAPGTGAADVATAPAAGGNGAVPPRKDDDHIARGRTELIQIERYYDRAAANAARFVYFWGMVFGAVPTALGGFLIAFVVIQVFGEGTLDPSAESTRFFFACYAAGALGAIVSVLTRMRSEDRFAIDYEIGRTQAFSLGAFRPFLGAVFGLLVYFALQSDLVQVETPPEGEAFFFVTLFAFAAGFSERLTHVILGGAEQTVTRTLEEADKTGNAPAAERPASQ